MTDERIRLVPGVVWRELDDTLCAVYSPLSGETHLLNTESVALVETLDLQEPRTPEAAAQMLAADSGFSPEEMSELLRDAWPTLLQAGLIRVCGSTACQPA